MSEWGNDAAVYSSQSELSEWDASDAESVPDADSLRVLDQAAPGKLSPSTHMNCLVSLDLALNIFSTICACTHRLQSAVTVTPCSALLETAQSFVEGRADVQAR